MEFAALRVLGKSMVPSMPGWAKAFRSMFPKAAATACDPVIFTRGVLEDVFVFEEVDAFELDLPSEAEDGGGVALL